VPQRSTSGDESYFLLRSYNQLKTPHVVSCILAGHSRTCIAIPLLSSGRCRCVSEQTHQIPFKSLGVWDLASLVLNVQRVGYNP
jgi:hypothetical protein